MHAAGLLAGLKVVEVAGWNGVLGGRILADAGADVVRVVPPERDSLDTEPPFFGATGVSIQSNWYNAGKRLVTLDLSLPEGKEQLLSLVERADILIDDWLPACSPLAGDEIARRSPRIARVSVTPMGLDGPLAPLRTNDLVANALSGATSITGLPDHPLNGYGNQTYNTVGLYVALCALVAARVARVSGRACHVDLSAHEALVSCTEQLLTQWLFSDADPEHAVAGRNGSQHWSGAYEICPTADGRHVMMSAALRLEDVLVPWVVSEGAGQDLADRDRFPSAAELVENLPYVMQVLRDWAATKSADELFLSGQQKHQPFAPIWSVPEVLAKSAQIPARAYFSDQHVPGAGKVAFGGRFFRSSADGPPIGPPAAVHLADIQWVGDQPQRQQPGMNQHLPLTGVRVLDFSHVLAGPFATRILGDLGAEVIKVGTSARARGTNAADHPYYRCWNRNKRSVTLNMNTPQGRVIAKALADESDIIVENFSPHVLPGWGLEFDAFAQSNPRLSIVHLNGMGRSGPWRDFVTVAPTIHALTGLTYLTNPAGRHDIGYGFSLTDHLAGLAGSVAAVAALDHRDRTLRGVEIDLSQYELGLGLMAVTLMDSLANRTDPQPVGSQDPYHSWCPHGIYPCAGNDSWIAIAAKGDDDWKALCRVLDKPVLIDDQRFASHRLRLLNEDALDAEIAGLTSGHNAYELMRQCQEAGLAAGVVQDAEDLGIRDPQLRCRGFFTRTTSRDGEAYAVDRFPGLFNGHPIGAYAPAPSVGADTFSVLSSVLGMPDDEIVELLQQGVLS